MVITEQGAKLVPVVVFITIWILQVFLLILSPYNYKSVSLETWIITLSSVSTVVVGYLTYYFLNTTRTVQITSKTRNKSYIDFDKNNLEKLLKYLLIFVAIGVIGDILYLMFTIKSYGLHLTNIFWYRFFLSHSAKGQFGWSVLHSLFSYLILLNNVVVIISAIYHSFYSGKKILIYGPIFLAFLFSVITLQRHTLIIILTFWLSALFFISFYLDSQRQKISLNKFYRSFIGILIFIALVIIIVISIRFYIDLGGAKYNKLIKLGIQSIYSYIAGNVVALDTYLKSDISYEKGAFLFQSILKWLSRLGVINSTSIPSQYLEFTNIGPVSLNTYTYIRMLYADYGVYGLLILSYLWGFIAAFVMNNLYPNFRLYKLMFAALMMFSYLVSFFGFSLLNFTMIFLLFFFSWILDYFIKTSNLPAHL